MTTIKLARLPDRAPVKLSINVTPGLAADLATYAALYRDVYGRDETIVDLIPAMLTAFLESDRAFMRGRKASWPTSEDRMGVNERQ